VASHRPSRSTAAEDDAPRRRRRGAAALAAGALALLPGNASAQDWPGYASGLSYLIAAGPKQYPVLSLLLGLIALSLLVVAIIAVLVVVGVFRRRAGVPDPAAVPLARSGFGLPWIYVGVGLTVPALLAIAVWTYVTLAAIAGPRGEPAFTIRVTGHQWWWEFQYVSDRPDRTFTTANELHVPVGKPVRLELVTADVIHSFWIPALSGKMDTIAGQQNVTWIQADKPGVYRGQCTEFCGQQHAHMGLLAVAEPEDAFDAWWDHQLAGPDLPLDEAPRQRALAGQAAFARHCGVCHAVRGTLAGGRVGPDLSHLMQRRTIAAATMPNTIGYLSGWIANPQHVKPGNYMPTLTLSGPELEQIRTYLEALR
jgi:cytochrome c oxidase subunit 2